MAVVADADLKAKGGMATGVVALLALATFINYVDRGNLATAAPLIKDQLKLTGTQMGLLLSAFFWTYTPGQLLSGWLAERINAYRTLAIGLALWSLATILSGLAAGFMTLIVLRLLLGLGESAAFPCSSNLLAKLLPSHELGGANGLIGAGLALGPAFGTLAGGLVMAWAGWRAFFIIFGAVSVLWLWPWLYATANMTTRDAAPQLADNAPSFLTILKRREAWGASLGHFSANFSFYFVISWLPIYLVKVHGFSVPGMAELGGTIYAVYAISSTLAGHLADRWIGAGGDVNRVRKSIIVASHAGVALAMVGGAIGNAPVSIASLFLAATSFGLNTPSIFAIGQTLAGPRVAGKWIGLQNCFANIAGIIAPYITGVIVDATGGFFWAFVASATVALLGIVGWGIVIRRVAPLNWEAADGFAVAPA